MIGMGCWALSPSLSPVVLRMSKARHRSLWCLTGAERTTGSQSALMIGAGLPAVTCNTLPLNMDPSTLVMKLSSVSWLRKGTHYTCTLSLAKFSVFELRPTPIRPGCRAHNFFGRLVSEEGVYRHLLRVYGQCNDVVV
jgi:hypothetical protein